jgi:beta-glucosidase
MKFAFRFSLALLLGLAGVAGQAYAQAPAAPAAAPTTPETVVPVPRDGNWMKRHEAMNARVKQGDVDLVFIGDSITAGWEGAGKEIWAKYYGPRKAVNLGIGGDRTQHVLWRLQNGNLEGITPKLAVIMIGTNNSNSNTPEDIAAGTKAIVEFIRQKTPDTKILLLATFPRGATPEDPKRQTNEKSNAIVKQLADDQHVFYLDIGDKFLEADGTLSKEVMPDLLHLNAKSYATWAEAIEPTVKKLMGES